MKLAALIFSVLTLTQFAYAGDHWDNCSNSTADIKIENGIIQIAGQESENISFKVLGKTVLKKERQTCVLKNSRQTVISYDNEASVQRIEVKAGRNKYVAYVVCDAGGSGIPANDECK